jgi:hypothetical protein
MTTTFEAIRDAQLVVIEALTPSQHADKPFRRHREAVEFMAWIAANPKACFRRLQALSNFDMEQGPTADGSVEGCRHSMELRIAYPLSMGKYGAANQLDMEDLMKQDLHQIDAAIGLNGGANYVSSQHDCRKTAQAVLEAEGARVLSMTYELFYDRSV